MYSDHLLPTPSPLGGTVPVTGAGCLEILSNGSPEHPRALSYDRPMSWSERWLPVLIFVVLVVLIGGPFAWRAWRDSRRPEPVEARVVSATAEDPVFRTGPRRVAPGVDVRVAVAVRWSTPSGRDGWVCPVDRLELDGTAVEHGREWPDDELAPRVFWFTIESDRLGGILDESDPAELLRYRTFLAPELGGGLLAEGLPDAHHDDHIATEDDRHALEGGTIRLYARVELVDEPDAVTPRAVAASAGPEQIGAADFPTLMLATDLGEGIDPACGELLRLPGIEADDPDASIDGLGRSLTDLVEARLVASSWPLAALALTGDEGLDPATLADVGTLRRDKLLLLDGRVAAWDEAVRPGDLVRLENHWGVLVGDTGDGVLDGQDLVFHCWLQPPALIPLAGFAPEASKLQLLRHEP